MHVRSFWYVCTVTERAVHWEPWPVEPGSSERTKIPRLQNKKYEHSIMIFLLFGMKFDERGAFFMSWNAKGKTSRVMAGPSQKHFLFNWKTEEDCIGVFEIWKLSRSTNNLRNHSDHYAGFHRTLTREQRGVVANWRETGSCQTLEGCIRVGI